MADPNDIHDPEPVDAEFEPADDDMPADPGDSGSRSGMGAMLVVFVLASLAGGALGFTGARMFPAQTDGADPDASAERTAITQTVTGLETRLAAIEAEDPAAIARDSASNSVSALEQRIAALETVPPGGVDLGPIEARIEELESASSADANGPALDRLTALEERAATIEAAQIDLQGQITAAETPSTAEVAPAIDPAILQNFTERLAALEAAADAGPAVTDSSAELAALTARIETLETALTEARAVADSARISADQAAETIASRPAGDTDAARQLAARALALTAMRDMAATGGAFEAERAALARLWRGNPDLAALASFSRAGAPTVEDLASSYPGDAIREAAGTGRHFFGLLAVRRVDPEEDSSDPLALTALAETRLANAELADAVMLTEQLPEAALEAAQSWLLGAQARLETDARLASLRQSLAEDATEQGADPS